MARAARATLTRPSGPPHLVQRPRWPPQVLRFAGRTCSTARAARAGPSSTAPVARARDRGGRVARTACRTTPTDASVREPARRRSPRDPFEHRAVIVHAYYGGCSVAEVARRLAHPRGHREVAPALRAPSPAPRTPGEGGDAMNPDHPRFADWDSAYVLGALSPAERREYEEHLETCETCRRSVAELVADPRPARPPLRRAGRGAPGRASRPPCRHRAPSCSTRCGARAAAAASVGRGSGSRSAAAAAAVVLAAIADRSRSSDRTRRPQSLAFETVADVPLTATAARPRPSGARGSSSTAATSPTSDATMPRRPRRRMAVRARRGRPRRQPQRGLELAGVPRCIGAPRGRHRPRPRRHRVARDHGRRAAATCFSAASTDPSG